MERNKKELQFDDIYQECYIEGKNYIWRGENMFVEKLKKAFEERLSHEECKIRKLSRKSGVNNSTRQISISADFRV